MRRIKWHRSACIGSTNSYLNSLNGGDPNYDYEVAVTDFQDAGRGQKGNTWESQSGKNLLFSILVHPHRVDASNQFIISQAIAMAVVESVAHAVPDQKDMFTVKWPNDIYWKDSKLAGILIENTIMGEGISHSVVGVGLNVNQEKFVSDAPNPVSLKNITGYDCNKESLLEGILCRFIELMEGLSNESEQLNNNYCNRLYRREGWHTYCDSEGCFEAQIAGVALDGRLELRTQKGEHRLYEFKQVSYVLPHRSI